MLPEPAKVLLVVGGKGRIGNDGRRRDHGVDASTPLACGPIEQVRGGGGRRIVGVQRSDSVGRMVVITRWLPSLTLGADAR